jgi:septum formation protein
LILESAGFNVSVVEPKGEPDIGSGEAPDVFVLRSAEAKMDFEVELEGRVATSADTVVVLDGVVLGKPRNEEEAVRSLRLLSGRVHEVFTGVVIRSENAVKREVVSTLVKFATLTEEEIKWYVATGEPMDKAGAYGILGYGSLFVEWIVGDFFNVMGYPVSVLYGFVRENLLREGGYV